MNTQDLSILQLVLHASFVVQLVIAILLVMSLASWSVIFGKLFGLKRVRALNEGFERDFWSGQNLQDLYADAAKKADASGPMSRIFASGMREFLKLRERRVSDHGARASSASSTRWSRTCPSSPRWARSRPMSACSAPCGGSCMPSPAWPTCSR